MFKFSEQLKQGQAGEETFLKAMGDKVTKLDGRKGDFVLNANGHKIELKSDYYDMLKTKNFFFERYSSVEKKNPGGPWQALVHEAQLFAYFFVKNACIYWFDTSLLVKELDNVIPHLPHKDIANYGFVTRGYTVPREALWDITKAVEILERK